ncbi:hypothetical protein KY290_011778 [Solanum tuberosum]|uniref:Uncharacterized protein n=1 Tax=Solanum tuberosum TaxID=4113 RepID=A0ABQ7W1N3_SOLTU|nr:hypothetical protein KY289_012297 [Solanum tuberosum]KAH0710444.1 hypothetical protein KY284_011871 [Solanum tuberosum]KAH0774641.1 hypothetical protein KY290_011778 [Solanum tuberosum]
MIKLPIDWRFLDRFTGGICLVVTSPNVSDFFPPFWQRFGAILVRPLSQFGAAGCSFICGGFSVVWRCFAGYGYAGGFGVASGLVGQFSDGVLGWGLSTVTRRREGLNRFWYDSLMMAARLNMAGEDGL